MAIKMKSGFTSFNGKIIGPKDGIVVLNEDAEARLVALGTAEYATVDPQGAPAADFGEEQYADPADAENGAEAATEAEVALNEPQEPTFASMTMAELKVMAESMGVSVKGLRSKAAVIEAIEAADKPPNPKVIE